MALASRFNIKTLSRAFRVAVARRHLGASSVTLADANEPTDPIQRLFLSKLNEYREKASVLGEGELVEPTSEIEEQRQFDMGNLTKRYGGDNMEEFPTFSFEK